MLACVRTLYVYMCACKIVCTIYTSTLPVITHRFSNDGQEDLLFNLDNKHLFYYDLLLNYMHLKIEGRNPLVAYLRASQHSHFCQSSTQGKQINVLRRAWISFARLLAISPLDSFQCPLCEQYPETIVCNGTMLGFRKDLLAIT